MRHTKSSKKSFKLSVLNPITKELHYFMVCAETGSILRAAERLDIQQAGLSKTIQRLEESVGRPLFYRRTRGIELTEFGKVLYRSLLKTKDYWDQVYFHEAKDSLGISGDLKLGCHPSVAASELPKFLGALLNQFPALNVQTEFDTSSEITRKVAEFKVDVGLVINPVRNADIVARPIHKEYIALWKASGKKGSSLLYNPDMFQGAKLLKKFSSLRQIQIKDYEVIASVLKKTDAVGMLPNTVAERHSLEQVGDKLLAVELAMIWHRSRFINSEKARVVELIQRSLR